jgi:hypothetical protein
MKRHVFHLAYDAEDRRFRRRHAIGIALFDAVPGRNARYG